ncbi:MAG: DEAD/DEAH box helicase [Parcubacteria group bacterium Gr01-1014_18]|nr:MAG: DEAD/DEAH box helicase [Parcubacteria group bacterium Greene0416_36]TSC81200.1 MAG: DEAD/DEAH box helicase [Parcubacteria group bacterium Gr01-1014_18]TSC99197.1 MAG: DEAD/DEAH box helicase [Parcubacteria group bacterium Greene1014_20]TSD07445.1 MAG: DEAD/DEAH box helicase [Parcubacteria group bacterium Greene0714_2]
MMNNEPKSPKLFSELGILPEILSALGSRFVTPTPIQEKVIPIAFGGKDVVGIAQTGTGKTLAFGIPMIQRLFLEKGQALILVPTRELAIQVEEMINRLARAVGFKTAVLIGGMPIYNQIKALKAGATIVIATPGRLADHLKQRTYSLNPLKIVVLDEADRMFDIGFGPEIKRILDACPKERQTLLFSATLSADLSAVASRYLRAPVRVEVAPQGSTVDLIHQSAYMIDREKKMQLLDHMLGEHKGTVLVFVRTKHSAKRITTAIRSMGHWVTELHSNRSLAQRRDSLAGFKSGKYRVLVCTDIASRGIDVKDISLVINFDLPDNNDDYVHRIGRTGRAGSFGKAISFASHHEKSDLRQIERLMRKPIPIVGLPPVLPAPRPMPADTREFSPRGQRPAGGSYPSRGGRSFGGGKSYGGHKSYGGGFSTDKFAPRSRFSTPKDNGGYKPDSTRQEDPFSSDKTFFKSEGGQHKASVFPKKRFFTKDKRDSKYGASSSDGAKKTGFSKPKSFGNFKGDNRRKDHFGGFN